MNPTYSTTKAEETDDDARIIPSSIHHLPPTDSNPSAHEGHTTGSRSNERDDHFILLERDFVKSIHATLANHAFHVTCRVDTSF